MPRIALCEEQRREYKLRDFKNWVVAKMHDNHKTQKEVGEALGLTQSTICKMLKVPDKKKKNEKIQKDPFSYGQVLKLCDFFEVDEDERKKLLMY